jgi:uncharacterized protein YjiS (DUF1127 family)
MLITHNRDTTGEFVLQDVTLSLPGLRYAVGRPISSRHRDRNHGFVLISMWIERVRERHALADLDDRLRQDVGLTQSQIWRECAKPFWR